MAIDRNESEERQARLDWMMEEFRTAQQRRVVKAGIALGNRADATQQAITGANSAPRDEAR